MEVVALAWEFSGFGLPFIAKSKVKTIQATLDRVPRSWQVELEDRLPVDPLYDNEEDHQYALDNVENIEGVALLFENSKRFGFTRIISLMVAVLTIILFIRVQMYRGMLAFLQFP